MNLLKKLISCVLVLSIMMSMLTGLEVNVSAAAYESSTSSINAAAASAVTQTEASNAANPAAAGISGLMNASAATDDPQRTALDYTIFSENSAADVRLNCWRATINGDMYTGRDFRFGGSELYLNGRVDAVNSIVTNGWIMNITSRNEKAPSVAMINLDEIISTRAEGCTEYEGSMIFQKNDIFLDESIKVEDSVKFNGSSFTGTCYIIAGEDISFNVNTLNAPGEDNRVLYSENGDITINGNEVTINGILYAPNGTVKINTNIFNLNGRIIADRIELNGSQFNINGTASDIDLLNKAPVVNAGADTKIKASEGVQLNGVVTDDAFLYSTPQITWEKVSGPGNVTFANNKEAVTTATFSEPGTYELKLTAFDGFLTSSDTAIVEVQNAAPVVNAGADAQIKVTEELELTGDVTDDGFPLSTPQITWEKISGPGEVTFADSEAVDTTVSFSSIGTYVLKLTAFDGLITASDTVTVEAQDATPPVVSATFNKEIYIEGDDAIIELAAIDNVAVAGCKLLVDGQETGIDADNTAYIYTLAAGTHTVEVSAWDAVGNVGTNSYTLTVNAVEVVPPEYAPLSQGDSKYGYKEEFVRDEWSTAANTIFSEKVIELVPEQFWQTGYAYYDSSKCLAEDFSFAARFTFSITHTGTAADGLAFVIQTTNHTAGKPGVGIGYQGITPSLAIEFDDWTNIGDPNSYHIGVMKNGVTTNHYALYNYLPMLTSGAVHDTWVEYDGVNDMLYLYVAMYDKSGVVTKPENPAIAYHIDLSELFSEKNQVYIGVTSATGTLRASHKLLGFEFDPDPEIIGGVPVGGEDIPVIEVTSPAANGNYTIGDEIIVKGTIKDNKAVTGYTVSIKADSADDFTVVANGTDAIEDTEICRIDTSDLSEGKYIIRIKTQDGEGNRNERDISVFVSEPDTVAPQLTVTASATSVFTGDPVTLTITASDDKSAVTISSSATNGSVQTASGIYTYTASAAGTHQITVTATDEAGNQTSVTLTIKAIDKSTDPTSPDVLITGLTDGQVLTAPIDITGTVTAGGLDYYVLEYAVAGSTDFTEFARGTTAVDNGILGTFDPTLLNNGWYTIRISGYGLTEISTTEVVVSVEGQMKLGSFSMAFQDMTVAVDNFPLTIIREYDSRDRNTSGDFGYGWNLSMSGVRISESVTPGSYWNQKHTAAGLGLIKYYFTEDRPHTVTIDWGNGQEEQFDLKLSPDSQILDPITYDISASYKAKAGTTSTLEAMGTSTGILFNNGTLYDLDMNTFNPTKYKLTKADGTVYVIDEKAGVESITYTDGTTLTFDEDGVYHSDGKSILFERDTAGRITKITDPAGREVTYTYDAAGNLTNVVDLSGATTSFEYDSSHYLTAIIDPRGVTVSRNEYDENGRLTATIDADGNRMEFTHDIAGRQEVIKDRLGNATIYVYDDRGNVLSETDANNNTTTYAYDANDQMTSKTDALGNTSLFSYDADAKLLSYTDAGGNVLTNTYNEKGYLTSMSALGVTQLVVSYDTVGSITDTTDAQGNTNTYSYDSENRVTGITDDIGEYVKFTYDAEGHAATATNGLGETSTFTYDAQGYCTSRSQNSTTDAGVQVITEHYAYDAAGHLTQIIYADGSVTITEYNNIGKISAAVDSKGRRTAYEYDLFGNLSKITYCDNTTETFAYDKEGRNTAATDRMGRTIQMTYDAVGNMLSITYPNTASISYTYDSVYRLLTATGTNGGVTDYEYDAIGRNTAIADALGNRTTFGYGAASLLTSMTDAKGNTYSYEYDLNGNRTKTTLPDGRSISTAYDARGRVTSVTDQNNYTTSYTYDTVDRLTAVTDAAGQAWNYTYNETGALTTVNDANGNITSYQYDTMGRVTQTTNAGGASASMTYDEAGNILTSTNYAGVTTTYTYDGLDRLAAKTTGTAVVSFTYTADGLLDTVTDVNGVTRYTYDTMNGLTDVQYPDGTYLHYVYDTAFRLTSIQTAYGTTGYAYDLMNRITSVTDLTGAVTSYTYDANGNRSTMTYANGVTTNYTYDTCNRLTAETVTDSAGTILESYAITLGAAGERTQIVELHRTVAYEYDSLYRLTKETISADGLSKETAYTYDAMGNRLTKTSDGVVTNYTYNVLNQLLSENDIAYTYDANGSQVSQQSPAKTAAYTYDQEGRLITAIVTAGGTTTTEEYRYNWTGIRTAKITDGVETKYLIDPNGSLSQVIAELDSAGNLLTFYTRGAELISLSRTGETRYYQYDANGSVRLLTDGAGAVTDTYTYDAFGNLLGKTGATVNNYLYNGEQFDANTGFYYLRARYMNPSTGTFISMDPAQGSIFDPVSLHKYLYANANPVMNCDPSGRNTMLEEMCVLGMQGVIGTYANFALTLIDIGLQGDEYKGDMGSDITKSVLSGFIAGCIGGALSPMFALVRLTAIRVLALLLIAVIVAMFGEAFKLIAEEVTPEGSFEDMSSNDLALLAVGIIFDTLGDVACLPIKTILISKEVLVFIIDFFEIVIVPRVEDKANA